MKKFTIPEVLMMGWEKTKNNYSKIFSVILIFILFGMSNKFLSNVAYYSGHGDSPTIILNFFLHMALLIIALIIGINVIKQGLVLVRGGEFNLNALLDYPNEFWKYIGGQILTLLAIVAGLICLIIPGIIIIIRLSFMKQVLVDQKLDPFQSMAKSFDMTRGMTWDLFVLFIGLIIFNLAGLLVFIIGLAVTIPVSFLGVLYLYDKLLKHA